VSTSFLTIRVGIP